MYLVKSCLWTRTECLHLKSNQCYLTWTTCAANTFGSIVCCLQKQTLNIKITLTYYLDCHILTYSMWCYVGVAAGIKYRTYRRKCAQSKTKTSTTTVSWTHNTLHGAKVKKQTHQTFDSSVCRRSMIPLWHFNRWCNKVTASGESWRGDCAARQHMTVWWHYRTMIPVTQRYSVIQQKQLSCFIILKRQENEGYNTTYSNNTATKRICFTPFRWLMNDNGLLVIQ